MKDDSIPSKPSRLSQHLRYVEQRLGSTPSAEFKDIADLEPMQLKLPRARQEKRSSAQRSWMRNLSAAGMALAAGVLLFLTLNQPDSATDPAWISKGGGTSLSVRVQRGDQSFELEGEGSLKSFDKVQFDVLPAEKSTVIWGVSSASKGIWLTEFDWLKDEQFEAAAKEKTAAGIAFELSEVNEQETLQVFVCPANLSPSVWADSAFPGLLLQAKEKLPKAWQSCEVFRVILRR